MTTIAAGTSQTFTAAVAGQTFRVTSRAGTIVTVSGATTSRHGPSPRTRSFGPYAVGQSITVQAELGEVLVELGIQTSDIAKANGELVSPSNIGRRAVIAGDSRKQANFDQTATAIKALPRSWNIAQGLSGHRLDLVQNAGVNGDTVAGLYARLDGSTPGVGFGQIGDATIAAVGPGVFGFNPDFIALCIGFNDIMGSGKSAALVFYGDGTATNPGMKAILDRCKAECPITVVESVVYANSAAAGYTAARAAQVDVYNKLVSDYCDANRGLYYCDTAAAVVDTTSAALETNAVMLRDGTVHENNRGSWLEAVPLAALIRQLVPARRDLLPSSNAKTKTLDAAINQLQVNPLLTGSAAITSTGFSGNCAGSNLTNANWVRGGGTPTAVLSVVPDPTGYGQATKIVCTFGAAGDTIESRMPSNHAQVAAGQKVRAVCQASWTGPGGAALAAADNLRGVQLYIQFNDGTTNTFSYDQSDSAIENVLVGSVSNFVFRSPEFTIPATGTPTIARANLTVIGRGVGSPEVTISRFGFEITG